MTIQRIRVELTGGAIEGPGLCTFFSETAAGASLTTGAYQFWNLLRVTLPSSVQIQVPNGGDLIDETNGTLTGTWGTSGSQPTISGGGGGGPFAQGVGSRVVWHTDTIRGGRRVRGSTFIIPNTAASYDAAGTLTPEAIGNIGTGVDAMLTALTGNLVVWSRPRPGLVGAAVPVARGTVPDKISTLRSRRT